MTAALLGQHEPQSPEWHELRKGGIGGSEIAAVVGLSPYESPFHLWHVKKGNIPGPTLSNAMDWGNRLEPLVVDWFSEQHPGMWVMEQPGTFAAAEREWQRCNPDALIYPPRDVTANTPPTSLLQVKTSRYGDGFGPSGSDQIPLHYRCQVQWEMDVFGVDHCWLAVLIGGNDPREYRIEADPEGQATLRAVAAKFWASLHEDDEPPIDATESTYEAVRELHPEIDRNTELDVPADWWETVATWRERIDQADAEYRLACSRILNAAGAAHYITVNGERVARRQASATGRPYLRKIA